MLPRLTNTAIVSSFLVCISFSNGSYGAEPKLIVTQKHLDKVESPDAKYWIDIIKVAGSAIATAYGYPEAAVAIQDIPSRNSKDQGNEHWGHIQAPVGYTTCDAYVVDPSLTCNSTFTGVIRTADHPGSGGIDGLHWYIVVPKPSGAFPGRCWVDGYVVVIFADASQGRPSSCKAANNGPTFHYGK
jgi:hypothetical protein